MTTIANIAQRILDENGYAVTDFSGLTLTILEYKIDDAITWLNQTAGLSVAALSGTAGSKSLVGTDGQNLIVKWLSNAMLRAYKEKGEQAGVGSINVSVVVNDKDSEITKLILKMAERLKSPPIYIANDPVTTE